LDVGVGFFSQTIIIEVGFFIIKKSYVVLQQMLVMVLLKLVCYVLQPGLTWEWSNICNNWWWYCWCKGM